MEYKELVEGLFGTSDPEELAAAAARLRAKNPRGAGRKQKLTQTEKEQMRLLREKGSSVAEVAAQYGVSRQLAYQVLKDEPDPDMSLRITLMEKQRPCTDIDVDFLNERVKIRNYTEDILHRAFGVIKNPTWQDFQTFLRDRCFSEARGDAEEILRTMGLDSFDPLQIVEKTKGKISDDELWLKFKYREAVK